MKSRWTRRFCAIVAGFMLVMLWAGALAQSAEPVGAIGTVENVEGGAESTPKATAVPRPPNPNEPQGTTSEQALSGGGPVYRVAGYTVELPSDWIIATRSDGTSQFQFIDSDGKRGVCAARATRVGAYEEGLDALGLLNEVCISLGAESPTMIQIGQKTVGVYETLMDGMNLTNAVFMNGMDVIMVQSYIQDATDTSRQRAIALDIVGRMEK